MRIEILNTGTELMLGNTVNTHGAWIGQELFRLGLRVARQTTVPDGEAIRDAMREAAGRCDVLLVTGGLGPTSDDITREAASEVLGIGLIRDETVINWLEEFFAKRGRSMPAGNERQAMVPVGADILPNPNGTAPGIYVPPRLASHDHCAVFLLPGPPRELHPMFHAEVIPRLKALAGVAGLADQLAMRFAGIGESDFHLSVDGLLAAVPNLEYGYCARLGEVDLRLIGAAPAIAAGREIALAAFSPNLVSEDGSSLEQVLVRVLTEKQLTLATAESCTGGLVASRITDVPGASAVFTHGFVTYSDEAKHQLLGVPWDAIEEHGAVSEQVARAMAEGALDFSDSHLAVAVTGIAGPGGGSEEKPVGTVWIAVASRGGETIAIKQNHPRGRRDFKTTASHNALDLLRRVALGIEG
jgi:nicotinamide-nucleotide amidase